MGLDAFYIDTVTLYNRNLDKTSGHEIWFPTLLENVSLVITNGTNVSNIGKQDADAAKLLIAINKFPKLYVEPAEWKRISEADKEKYMTFTAAEDFYVEGNTVDVEIKKEGFYEWMRKNHNNVFKISGVTRYKVIMPHLEVGGK